MFAERQIYSNVFLNGLIDVSSEVWPELARSAQGIEAATFFLENNLKIKGIPSVNRPETLPDSEIVKAPEALNAQYTTFDNVGISDMDAKNIDLSHAQFRNSYIRNTKLTGNLSWVHFTGTGRASDDDLGFVSVTIQANLSNASFRDMSIRNSALGGTDLNKVAFINTRLSGGDHW